MIKRRRVVMSHECKKSYHKVSVNNKGGGVVRFFDTLWQTSVNEMDEMEICGGVP